MFCHQDLKGGHLPQDTLCLTYDDGPGPQTAELSRFLADHGISATFFVIGEEAASRPDVLQQLHADGHVLGNHTWSHPGLVSCLETGGDVIHELAAAHNVIREFCDDGPIYFRPPYGNWRQVDSETGSDCEHSIVAKALAAWGEGKHYVGPVNWDISAEDFDYWLRRRSPQACAAAYLDLIHEIGSGIVLMHDGSENPDIRARNQTFAVTRQIVPELLSQGYRFIALDEVINLP